MERYLGHVVNGQHRRIPGPREEIFLNELKENQYSHYLISLLLQSLVAKPKENYFKWNLKYVTREKGRLKGTVLYV
jgi:hypothetical protein